MPTATFLNNIAKKSFISTAAIIFASVYTCISALLILKISPIFFFSMLSYAPFTTAATILAATAVVGSNPNYFITGVKKLIKFSIDATNYVFNATKDVGEKLAGIITESIDNPASYITRSYAYSVNKYYEYRAKINSNSINVKNLHSLAKSTVVNISGLAFAVSTTYASISLGVIAIPYFANLTLTTYPFYIAASYLGTLVYSKKYPKESAEKASVIIKSAANISYKIPQKSYALGAALANACLESETPGKTIKYAYDGVINNSKTIITKSYDYVVTQSNRAMRKHTV